MAKFISVLHSESRSTNTDSPTYYNWENQYALHAVVDVTSGGNLLVSVMAHDDESDRDYTILTSAILASGTSVLRVGPDYTAGANIAKDYMPSEFYFHTVPSGATTFSIGASLI